MLLCFCFSAWLVGFNSISIWFNMVAKNRTRNKLEAFGFHYTSRKTERGKGPCLPVVSRFDGTRSLSPLDGTPGGTSQA